MTSGLTARVRSGVVDADLDLPPSTVALVGPNGAGKTTLLKAVAGLAPNDGTVVIAGTDVTSLPVARRQVGYVPQHVALFPHLDVLGNVAFGASARARRRGRTRAREHATEWLSRLDVTHLANRRPRTLSGGQAQRVALARALASQPRVLLLDEPLSAMDATARPELRTTLRTHLSQFAGTAVVVSHDLADVWALADHLVVLEQGRVVQQGSAQELTRHPASVWVARMLGHNAWPGLGSADGRVTVASTLTLRCPADASRASGVWVRPEAVQLHAAPPAATDNVWQATVTGVEPHGSRLLVQVAGPVAAVAEVNPTMRGGWLTEGAPVWARVEVRDVRLLPA